MECPICLETINNNSVNLNKYNVECSCYKHKKIHADCFIRSNETKKCLLCNKKFEEPLNIIFYCNIIIDDNTSQTYLVENAKYDHRLLRFVNSNDALLSIVKKDGLALKYINNQTEDMCMEAVKQNPHALQFVINQTYNICIKALDGDIFAVGHIRNENNERVIKLGREYKKQLKLSYIKHMTPIPTCVAKLFL